MNLNYVQKVISVDVPKDELMKACIESKLAASEEEYNRTLELTQEYLLSRDNLKVLKTIEREQKKEDKLNGKVSKWFRKINNNSWKILR